MQTKIFLVTGKKQSGKDTTVDYLMNQTADCRWYSGGEITGISLYLSGKLIYKKYSFADPLKKFLMDVFGLSYKQCYGTDEDKNTTTKVKWGNLPFNFDVTLELFKKCGKKSYEYGISFGDIADIFLTSRELMQVFGTNIVRRMYNDAWASATLNKIISENPKFAFICDARFPNEIEVFKSYNPYIIRLLRNIFPDDTHESEIALDSFNFSEYKNFFALDNRNLSLEEKNKILHKAYVNLLCDKDI